MPISWSSCSRVTCPTNRSIAQPPDTNHGPGNPSITRATAAISSRVLIVHAFPLPRPEQFAGTPVHFLQGTWKRGREEVDSNVQPIVQSVLRQANARLIWRPTLVQPPR